MTSTDRLAPEQLREIIDLSRLVTSSLDPAEVRRRAVEAAARLVDAERASLLLIDARAHKLYFEVALGDDTGEVSRFKMVPGQGIAGSVIQSCSAEIINDVQSDTRFSPDLDRRTGFTTRSMICAPLTCKDAPLGVLEVINKRSGEFTEDDRALVTLLANEIAIAVENARLYARLRRSYFEVAIYTGIFAVLFVAAGLWLLSLAG